MCAGVGEPSSVDDQVFLENGPPFEPAFENLPRSGRAPRLRGQRGSGNVRRHPVMGHGPPRMFLRRRLRKQDIPRITGQSRGSGSSLVLNHMDEFLDAAGLDAQFFKARKIVCRDIVTPHEIDLVAR